MRNWKATQFLSRKSGNRKSNRLDIQCDIFQGDSLTTLLFCLVLIPWTTELNRIVYEHKIGEKSIDNLFYMDDVKLFAKEDHELKGCCRQ